MKPNIIFLNTAITIMIASAIITSCKQTNFTEESDSYAKYHLKGEVKKIKISKERGLYGYKEYNRFADIAEIGNYDLAKPGVYKFYKTGLLRYSDNCSISYHNNGKSIKYKRAGGKKETRKYDNSGNMTECTIYETEYYDNAEFYIGKYKRVINKDFIHNSDTLLSYNFHKKLIDCSADTLISDFSTFMKIVKKPSNIIMYAKDILPSTQDLRIRNIREVEPDFDFYNWFGNESGVYREEYKYSTSGQLEQKQCWANDELVSQVTIRYDNSNRIKTFSKSGDRKLANDDIHLDNWTWASVGYIKGNKMIYNKDVPSIIIHYNYNEHNDIEVANITIQNDNCYYGNDSNGNVTINYVYEYDSYGNWLTRLSYADNDLIDIIQREISYYNGEKTKWSDGFYATALANDIAMMQQRHEQKKREEEERKYREEHPVEVIFDNLGFCYARNIFRDGHSGDYAASKDDLCFKFDVRLKNMSDKTFIKMYLSKKYEDRDFFKTSGCYLTMSFNKEYILRNRHGWDSKLPEVSFDEPWKPNETKNLTIILYEWDDDEVTEGFKEFTPNFCTLNFVINVEDSNGKITTIPYTYNIMPQWNEFINKSKKGNNSTEKESNSFRTDDTDEQEPPAEEEAVLDF